MYDTCLIFYAKIEKNIHYKIERLYNIIFRNFPSYLFLLLSVEGAGSKSRASRFFSGPHECIHPIKALQKKTVGGVYTLCEITVRSKTIFH